jgi:hypothetical protein
MISLFFLLNLFSVINLSPCDMAKDKVYILFETRENPKAYFRLLKKTGKSTMGYFHLEKNSGDCSSNDFFFYKEISQQSVIKVKLDTLKNILTSEWVATQPDSVLLQLFRYKDIYVIPKDSLKANEGHAFLTSYSYCEIE